MTPPAATPPPSPPSAVGFQTAYLGESLDDWRRQAPPGATCRTLTGAPARAICAAPPVDLGGHQVARDISYGFVEGRLVRIRFLTSIDAYDRVRARLDGRFGAPSPITYDAIQINRSVPTPHQRDVWRRGGALIVLSDPERDGYSLSVTYSLDAARALPPPPPVT